MTTPGDLSRTGAWVTAARPHTLPAAVSPVVVGTGLAIHDGVFAAGPAIAALLGATLIQIGTNLANDYFDAVKGADTPDRAGFTRVTAGGIIPAERVWLATIVTYAGAVVVGGYLVVIGGLPIVIIGVASIASGVLYTGGPYPYGYYALGDVFVFVFFGLVAVTGTYYVQAVSVVASVPLWVPADTVPVAAVVASLPMAGLITAILVVNNIRDIETDRRAGKRTLAVVLGYRGSRIEFLGLLAGSYVALAWFLTHPSFPPTVLLPLLTLPYAGRIVRTVLTRTDAAALDPALERTGRLTAAFAALFGVGLAV